MKLRAALLAAVAGLTTLTAQAADPIKIGLILPYSGVYASIGNDITDALSLALEEAGNKVGEHDIVLLKEDSETKPPVGLAKAKKLVHQEEADILVGPVASHVAGALAQFVDQAQVPLIIPNAGSNDLTGEKCSPWVLRTSFSNDQIVRVMGKWLKDNGYDSAFLMAPDYAAGHQLMEGFKKPFEEAGGKIVGEAYTPFQQTKDFGPYFAQVKAAAPKALFVFYAGGEAIQFVKQYDAFGMKEQVQLTGAGWLTSPSELPAQGDAALGFIGSLNYVPTIDNPVNKAFQQNFQAKYGRVGSEYAAQGYDTGKVILAALEKLNGDVSDKAAFVKAIHEAPVEGTRGTLRIDPKTNNIIQDIVIFKTEKAGEQINLNVIETIPQVQDAPNGCTL